MFEAFTGSMVVQSRPSGFESCKWYVGAVLGRNLAEVNTQLTTPLHIKTDPDLGTTVELKCASREVHLRRLSKVPWQPGRYLRACVRVKAVAGPLPKLRLACKPMRGDASGVDGAWCSIELAPFSRHREVLELSAVFGPAARPGVDCVLGVEPRQCHFGIDVAGAERSVLRISDIICVDVTAEYASAPATSVDVVDFGAVGDGKTDCAVAFEAANRAAVGRTISVPSGVFFLGQQVILDAPVAFIGRLRMPDSAALVMRDRFDLGTYIAAFGDEERGFRKALQALFCDEAHVALDMGGRRVRLSEPVDVAGLVPKRSSFAKPRTLRNGLLEAGPSAKWQSASGASPSYMLDFTGFRALDNFRTVELDFACHDRCEALGWPASCAPTTRSVRTGAKALV